MPDEPTPDVGAQILAFLEGKLTRDEELALAQYTLEFLIPKAQLALEAIKVWRGYGPDGPFAPAETGIPGGFSGARGHI